MSCKTCLCTALNMCPGFSFFCFERAFLAWGRFLQKTTNTGFIELSGSHGLKETKSINIFMQYDIILMEVFQTWSVMIG